MPSTHPPLLSRFRAAYAEHRRREGHHEIPVHDLPYVRSGPLRKIWAIRAKSFEKALRSVIQPLEQRTSRALSVVDLGAGNGWLSHRLSQRGNNAIAVDLRSDDVDGLGAATGPHDRTTSRLTKIVGDFSNIPLRADCIDICIFNASFHYATSVNDVLSEAARITRPGGRILIIDTPFYRDHRDGEKMVAEKRKNAAAIFGDLTPDLTAISFVEFLTPDVLTAASQPLGLAWTRHRVRYPLWYEMRPWIAWLRRKRSPSRFDVWEGSFLNE